MVRRVGRGDDGNVSRRVIAMPERITEKVAYSAVDFAKQYGRSRNWKSTEALRPIWGRGWAGLNSPFPHLLYQNFGTRPRVMWELEGKVVPIRDATGLHFVRAVGVGQPGWARMPDGRMIWREQKWKHPGIKPTMFMNKAIKQAVRLHKSELQRSFVSGFVDNLRAETRRAGKK